MNLPNFNADLIPTGLEELDQLLGGLRPGCVYLLVGYPGIGTSTLALGIAREAAIRARKETLYLSARTPAALIQARALSAAARVPLDCILNSSLMREGDPEKLEAAYPLLAESPLLIDDAPYRDFRDIDARLDRGYRGESWKLIVADGTNILARPTAPEQLWATHTRVSVDLKRAARRTNAAVIITTPTNRRADNRLDRSPTLSDVATSSAYAADADVVIGVHREDYHVQESDRPGEADLVVMKSRYSPQRTITVAFQGHYCRFVDMAR